MCLVTRQRKPIITTKDMIVYKTVFSDGSPYYYATSFQYKKGVVHKTDLVITKDVPNIGHCYSEKQSAYYVYNNNTKNKTCKIISQGFHFAFKDSDVSSPEAFLIPKGSIIYKDATGLGVTNQIMWL